MGCRWSWYSGRVEGKNEVGILVDRDLRELVVEVRRVNDKLIGIKLVVGGFTLNVISAYAPQVGLDEEVKRCFWEDFDEVVCGIPYTEKLFIGRDFNGHIGATSRATMTCMSALVSELETELTLVSRRRMSTWSPFRVRWPGPRLSINSSGSLVKGGCQRGIGVSKGSSGGRKGDWWWSTEVQGKVEAKKAAYLKLLESVDEEVKRTNKERYKMAKKEAKLAVRPRLPCLKAAMKSLEDEDGKVLLDEALIGRRWQTYFHKLLNEEEDRNIELDDLEHSESRRDFEYCRRRRVEEVEAMHKISRGRATGPGYLMSFLE
uniref:Craniofacial development protein 2-like n=1 Tax=Nicotiana tabacum TaxID=4097 RepID=A0A1S3ZA37_TOBAC|nr:PREDICTED: uncharacterized protein LOC107784463 [Nicotiana tabacum]